MLRVAIVLSLSLGWAQMATAASLAFDFTARIDSGRLIPTAANAQIPVGETLHGRMTYNLTPTQRIGGDYFFAPGLETITIWTDQGFRRTFDNRLTGIATSGGTDFFYAQSFISEDPNGWNLSLNIAAKGWLGGRTELPLDFPDAFEFAFLEAYKTDAGNRPQFIDATIQSVASVAAVPLPPAAILLGGVVLLGLGHARARRRILSAGGE